MEQEIRGTKNLGLIQAIHSGTTPPLNIKIIWYDDNLGQKIHKYYDVVTSTWIPFGNNGPVTINGHYVYIAYASDCDGADFSLTFNPTVHKNCSIISSQTEIPSGSILPNLFEGKWIKFCDGESSGGNYTYVRYADDCDGLNFSETPVYEVPCVDCEWVDDFTVTKEASLIDVEDTNDGIVITFDNAYGNQAIRVDLLKGGNALDNYINYNFQIIQVDSFVGALGDDDCSILIDTDYNNPSSVPYEYTNSPSSTTSFMKQITGSQFEIRLSPLNTNAFSGKIILKIGDESCGTENPGGKCYSCRKFIGIINSDTPINPLSETDFEGFWLPIGGGGCGCGGSSGGSSGGDIQNLYEQLNNLSQRYIQDFNNMTQIIESQANLIDGLQNQVDQDKIDINQDISNLDDKVDNNHSIVTGQTGDLALSISGLDLRVSDIEDNFDANSISAKIQPNISVMLDDFKTNEIDDDMNTAKSDIVTLQQQSLDYEDRITILEGQ